MGTLECDGSHEVKCEEFIYSDCVAVWHENEFEKDKYGCYKDCIIRLYPAIKENKEEIFLLEINLMEPTAPYHFIDNFSSVGQRLISKEYGISLLRNKNKQIKNYWTSLKI
jgi:hypothetical protein